MYSGMLYIALLPISWEWSLFQTQNNITRLQESETNLTESINQYNALISGDPDAKEPVDPSSVRQSGKCFTCRLNTP